MKSSLALLTLVVLSLFQTACTVESESWVNQDRLEVRDDLFTDTIETRLINDDMIRAVGEYYYRYGNGPLNLVVSYNDHSRTNTRAKAETALKTIRDGLIQNGVQNINATTSVVASDTSTTLISFPALVADAPTNCGLMPGYEYPAEMQSDPSAPPKYKMGCTVETLLARQVSRPSDLLGKTGFETNSDGRRQERVLSTRGYYGDAPNAPLDGEKASEAN